MSLRIARALTRVRPSGFQLSLQRRGYADAVSDKIKLTLALPHQVGAPKTKNRHYSSSRDAISFMHLSS